MTPKCAHVSRIVCVGAAGIDRLYRALGTLAPGTSNPAALSVRHGGVARNVAETLARLGHEVALVSIVGDDPDGADLMTKLESAGVETRYVARSVAHRTAEYTAILRPDGELELGAADVSILDEFGDADLARARDVLANADLIFADCNLPRSSLQSLVVLAAESRSRFAVDAVSIAKSSRLPRRLDGVALLFVNAAEAEALAALPVHAAPEETSRALRERGAAAAVVGLGSRGTLIRDDAGVRTILPHPPERIVDVTGAGDAMVAGTIEGLLGGASLDDAVRTGGFLAALTLECEGSVRSDLNRTFLESERERSIATPAR